MITLTNDKSPFKHWAEPAFYWAKKVWGHQDKTAKHTKLRATLLKAWETTLVTNGSATAKPAW